MMAGMRIGIGYDIHPLVPARRLILGGVEIPFELGLDGHSDADVLSHAVMDALLGAAAMGDLGRHFPPSDPAYKDADSLELLRRVSRMVDEKGWHVGNVDATIVAQEPRLAPFIEAMRECLSETLGLDNGNVSVKACSPEGIGSLGRREGISCYAVAMLVARD